MSTTVPHPADSGTEARTMAVDCDVHPHMPNGLSTLVPYMPEAWRKRVAVVHAQAGWAQDVYASQFSIPKNVLYINPVGVMRRDAVPDDGSVPASNPEIVQRQLLDAHGIDRAVLIGGNMLGLGALPDPDLAAVIASAYNDWLTEHWLEQDERFRGSLVVAPQDIDQAVAEIERVGDRAGMVQIFLPGMATLMGDRHFNKLYAAAAERKLPIAVHPNSADGIFTKAPPLAGGTYTYYIEWHTALSQIFQANTISMVCQGVFERFPELRIVITEGGFSWVPDVMWRLDKDWRSVRDEVPWLKRLPSEYIVENVRFTTQPIPEPDDPKHLEAMIDIVHGEQTLVFSSDYPHWDFDNPLRALAEIPEAIRERVRSTNAVELYGDRLL